MVLDSGLDIVKYTGYTFSDPLTNCIAFNLTNQRSFQVSMKQLWDTDYIELNTFI
jgi:hypothetical protein